MKEISVKELFENLSSGVKFVEAPEDITYNIGGEEYPVISFIEGTLIPLVDIPMVSDYKWQYDCLIDRIKNRETYEASGEDVELSIEYLKDWLIRNVEKAELNDIIYNCDLLQKATA